MAVSRFVLISVSDKQGVVEFASGLVEAGFTVLSTGGTGKILKAEGVPVTSISEHTGYPEIMGGRLKTLHPKIHGGILCRRGEDDTVVAKQEITPIEIVAVNLYPFAEKIANPKTTLAEAIEQIDIGGPAMLRAAAKNFAWVSAVVDPKDYADILAELQQHNQVSRQRNFALARKVFAHTANYDGIISNYLGSVDDSGDAVSLYPETLTLQFSKAHDLRYGENPHQMAAAYKEQDISVGALAGAVPLQGKALSYNNLSDAHAAWECVSSLSKTACVIVKHNNPCGAAVAKDANEAYLRAFASDPISAFGGVIAFNDAIDQDTAAAILEKQFVEVVLASSVSDKARVVFSQKPNVRVLILEKSDCSPKQISLKRIGGGLLVQEEDIEQDSETGFTVATKRSPSSTEMDDLRFSWGLVRHVKSNAIVYVKDLQLLGVGAGQASRVFSVEIGALHASQIGSSLCGSSMASDAFFPFRDAIDKAAELGVSAIIQPGGSMRDNEVIAAADAHNIAMVCTGVRHFSH